MRTSVSRLKPAGFTILEAIIVLVLLGTVLAVVAPNLSKRFTSFSNTAELRKIASQINFMSKKSFHARNAVSLDRKTLNLPGGWDVRTKAPIIFSQKGFCSGGEIVITKNQEILFAGKLEPPFCELKLHD